MLNFLMNDKVYEIQANNQISVILSQFDSGYVMDIVEDTLTSLFNNFDTIAKPNVVQAFESNFKELYSIYPTDISNINQCRLETYMTIIDIICKKYELKYVQPENIDIFTIAAYFYDFFVSRFNQYIINFYSRYIMDEKDNIYTNMNLESLKKNKDVSSVYSHLTFNNDEALAVVTANLPTVLRNLAASTQVPDHLVYYYTYGNQPAVINIFESSLTPIRPLFTRFNSLLFNDLLYGPMIVNIRLQIQKNLETTRDMNAAMAANMK